jgi:hypothetical protein
MAADVIPFPCKEQQVAYRIPLYGENEVKIITAIINIFGEDVEIEKYWYMPSAATTKNLKLYPPTFVIHCLKKALESDLFSAKGKKTISTILGNIETIENANLPIQK